MKENCMFCQLSKNPDKPHLVYANEKIMVFIDPKQFHPGHTLLIPRVHYSDIRELDNDTGAALMSAAISVTQAVGKAFPNDGLSLWHSIGPAAFQEVPHLHIHIHPRKMNDDILQVYPSMPTQPSWDVLAGYANVLRQELRI